MHRKYWPPAILLGMVIFGGMGALTYSTYEGKSHHAAVIAMMKDPTGVMFRNETEKPGAFKIRCGEVNGHNSFGAYGGWQWFEAWPPIGAGGKWNVIFVDDNKACQ